MSDETARAIDEEIKEFVNRNYQRAATILKENEDILHAMKDALMEYETIDALQVDDLMNRTKVRPPADFDTNDSDDKSDNNADSNKPAAKADDEKEDSAKPKSSDDTSDIPAS